MKVIGMFVCAAALAIALSSAKAQSVYCWEAEQTCMMQPSATAAPASRKSSRTAVRGRSVQKTHQQAPQAGLAVVRSKAGATARVAAQYRAAFQAYIDDLEGRGAVVRFMGGIREGRCWLGSQHSCGWAVDICQTGWGRVDRRCRLPPRAELISIARRHGLWEGGAWCSNDYGHVQAKESAPTCRNLYSAIQRFKEGRNEL